MLAPFPLSLAALTHLAALLCSPSPSAPRFLSRLHKVKRGAAHALRGGLRDSVSPGPDKGSLLLLEHCLILNPYFHLSSLTPAPPMLLLNPCPAVDWQVQFWRTLTAHAGAATQPL